MTATSTETWTPASTGNDTSSRPATADDVTDTRSAGAISKTEFTVTATVAGDDPNENCSGDSGDSETGEDGANTVTLSLVEATFDAGTCEYDITAALPAGFVADDDSNVAEDVDPVANDPDADDDDDVNTPDDEDDDPADNKILTVSVASVNVYLVQNVTGDAGGASAAYSGFESSCGGPDELNLPGNLKAERSGPSSTSGIHSTEGVTLVELRSGRYNITAALNTDKTDFTARTSYVLDVKGETCTASADIDDVPENCTVTSTSPLALVEAGEAALIEYTIDCSAPVEPEPPAEPEAPAVVPEAPVDDDTGDMTGGDDDDTGDMTGGDDDDTGDMTGGDDDTDDGAVDDTDDTDDMDDMDDIDTGPETCNEPSQEPGSRHCRTVSSPDPDCPTG